VYYHCTELKHVKYGKIYPAPETSCDVDLIHAYRWLGNYCGYCPQIWLSCCNVSMTGFRNDYARMKDGILFGFDWINGFGVDYDMWCMMLGTASMHADKKGDELSDIVFRQMLEIDAECAISDPDHILYTKGAKTSDEFLESVVFKGTNQFVLPCLNLKTATKIVCRNEKQKKKLRRKGFIEDRIMIRNVFTY